MRKFHSLFIYCLIVCASIPMPLATANPTAKPLSEALSLQQFASYIQNFHQSLKKITPENCTAELRKTSQYLYNARYKKLDDFYIMEKASQNRSDIISKLFQLRLALHKQYRNWVGLKEFSDLGKLEECAHNLRILLRTLRGWEDVWGLQYLHQTHDLDQMIERNDELIENVAKDPALARKRVDNVWPSVMVRPEIFANFDFLSFLRTGDVLLSRGSTFTSSVISRIGETDNQFSHLSIVYRADGKVTGLDSHHNPLVLGHLYVIEAELNEGLRIVPIEYYLQDNKVRIVLLRYRSMDSQASSEESIEISKYAGTFMAQKAVHEKICYNFLMEIPMNNVGNEKCLFCSQSVGVAYTRAYNDLNITEAIDRSYLKPETRLVFPLIYTTFNPEANALVATLGVKVHETFAPADVEVDPRLEIMAEWRNYAVVPNARHYDMIITQIFEWMEHAGYKFPKSDAIKALGKFGQYMAVKTNKMPPETPSGYVEGTALMGMLIELNGAKLNIAEMAKTKIDGAADMIKNQLDQKIQEFAKYLSAELKMPQSQINTTIDLVKDQVEHLKDRRGFKPILEQAEGISLGQIRVEGVDLAKIGEVFLTDMQLEQAMEQMRAADCQRLQKGNAPVLFHDILRADFSGDKTMACNPNIVKWWESRGQF